MPHLYDEVNEMLAKMSKDQPEAATPTYDALTTDASSIEVTGIKSHVPGGVIHARMERLLKDIQVDITKNPGDYSLRGLRSLSASITHRILAGIIITPELVDDLIKDITTLQEPTTDTSNYLNKFRKIHQPVDAEEVKELLLKTLADDRSRIKHSSSLAFWNPQAIKNDTNALLALEEYVHGIGTRAELQVWSATLNANKALDTLAKSGNLDLLVGQPVKTAKEFISVLLTREARELPAFAASSEVKHTI